MRVTALPAAIALLLLGTGACNVYGNPSDVVHVTGVKVTPQSVVLTAVGQTKQLFATIQPADASDMEVTWESTNTAVATVNTTGLVTATGIGDGVFITVHTHDGDFQASVNVSVQP